MHIFKIIKVISLIQCLNTYFTTRNTKWQEVKSINENRNFSINMNLLKGFNLYKEEISHSSTVIL